MGGDGGFEVSKVWNGDGGERGGYGRVWEYFVGEAREVYVYGEIGETR